MIISLLKEALDKNEITDYPKENFYLFTLPENQTNTGGQFKTLYKEHEDGNIDLNNAEIAIVTNAYHFPRVNTGILTTNRILTFSSLIILNLSFS
ncbi:MAG: hypothetical protein LN589_01245 [Rickettsia endosymbiont of Eriopis connexa]|nr:hypothetical protein [Rickettsia endosymbiont of Eriopis connexa]